MGTGGSLYFPPNFAVNLNPKDKPKDKGRLLFTFLRKPVELTKE